VTVGAGGQITDLAVEDHACLTFGEPEELFDLTAAFVRDGLSDGRKVVWLSDAAPDQVVAELTRRGIAARDALAAGQLTPASCEGRLLSAQAFAAEQAIEWLTGLMSACSQQGFAGLRVAVDMSWAFRPVTGVEQLPEFEAGVAAALSGTSVSMLCQYDRERFDPVTLASVIGAHTLSVAAATYFADAVLRICRQYAPPGIRLAGELDYQAEEPLALALAEAIRLDGDITINMMGLTFVDVPCSRMILDAARGLAPHRKMILLCPDGICARFALLGARLVPGVRLVSEYGS
jgi:hypothetical protein